MGASFLFHKKKTQLRSRDIKPDAEERERERETDRERERQREARADERNDGAKNRVVVGMVTLVVSFSGVVFAREREEDTKKTKKTTTNGRRNYLKTQKSAFANARGF